MEADFERRVLVEARHTGAQAAGETWRSPAVPGNGEVDSNEVWEVLRPVVIPPRSATGTPENLTARLVIDDRVYPDLVIPCTDTLLVNPPAHRIWQTPEEPKETPLRKQPKSFGRPMCRVGTGPMAIFRATCPKVRRRLQVETMAGTGGVTGDYVIRLIGYRYKAAALSRVVQPLPAEASFTDPFTGRVFSLTKQLQVSPDTWTQLPGGLDQAVPKVLPYQRIATNSQATQVNTPYVFDYPGNVASADEELVWDFDVQKRVLILQGLGFRYPDTLAWGWVNVGGNEWPKNRHSLLPRELSDRWFGSTYPRLPEALPFYEPTPALEDQVLVWNEKAYVAVQDNGTQVAAGQIYVIVDGVLIELT